MNTQLAAVSSIQQEQLSRHQLSEQLTEFGWKPIPIQPDDGEDFSVEVRIRGRPTGMNFYVQLKSVRDLAAHVHHGSVIYDAEVRHLARWETFNLPVVFIVWDIHRREGRWALVQDLIRDLDRRRPDWRSGRSCRLYIPCANGTDSAGLYQLQRRIGLAIYPLLARGRTMHASFQFEFPDSPAGDTARAGFDRFLAEGEPAVVSGEFIAHATFSAWINDWIVGDGDLTETTLVLIPDLPDEVFHVDIDFLTCNGDRAALPRTEMRVVRRGAQFIELSNKHATPALECELTLRQDTHTPRCSLRWQHLGANVYETRQLVHFRKAVSQGGKLRLTFVDHDNVVVVLNVPAHPEIAPEPRIVEMVEKVHLIADRMNVHLRMPSDAVSAADLCEIDELVSIATTGRTVLSDSSGTLTLDTADPSVVREVMKPGDRFQAREAFDESVAKLFGTEWPLGPVTHYLSGVIDTVVSHASPDSGSDGSGQTVLVSVHDVEHVSVYPHLLTREAERLAEHLVTRFGAQQVYHFGSLVWDDALTIRADIDLAVRGLPVDRLLEAVGWVESESSFAVDLVNLDYVSDHLRDRILSEGKLLRGREAPP